MHPETDTTTQGSRTGALALPLLAAGLLLVVLWVRIRLLGTPLERDEGEFAYMGQLLLKGIAPYTGAYTMKLPGVALCYALFMALFGQTVIGIHLGLLVVTMASSALLFRCGATLFDRATGAVAAAFYALLAIGMNLLGMSAHATHFVVLFSLAGIVLLQRAAATGQRLPLLFCGGLCFGLALLMKQHAVILLPFAVYCLIRTGAGTGWHRFARESLLFLLGALVPCLAVTAWLVYAGAFPRFWFWTVQYASAYASENSLATGLSAFTSQFSPILRDGLPVWLLSGAGVAMLCRKGQSRGRSVLIGLTGASFLMICPGLYFRPHYFILLLPPVALLAARATTRAAELPLTPRLQRLLPLLLFAGAALYCLAVERDYLFRATPLEVSRSIYGTNPFPEAIPIADYIRRHSGPRDRVAILGSEPEILFHADRLSATGHIYMYGLMEKHRYAEQMQAQVVEEIEASHPAFIVVVHNSASWLLKPDSLNSILDWGDRYISLRYDEVGIIDIPGNEPTRYLWDGAVAGYEPRSDSFVSVYRRRW
jgi:hypothetical protein